MGLSDSHDSPDHGAYGNHAAVSEAEPPRVQACQLLTRDEFAAITSGPWESLAIPSGHQT